MGILHSKYNDLNEGVLVYNKKGIIKYINKSCLQLFKYPEGKCPNTIFDLMEEPHRKVHESRIKSSDGKNTMFNKDVKGLRYDGTLVMLDIIILPGDIFGKVAILKQRTTEVLFEYKTFFEITNNGLFISKTDGTIVQCNENFASVIGYKPEEIINTNFMDLVYHKDHQKTLDAMVEIASTRKLSDFSNRYVSKSGELINLSWNVIEKEDKYYGTANNINERLKILADLYRSNMFLKETEELSLIGSWEWCIDTGKLVWSQGLKNIYELEDVSYENYIDCNHPDDIEEILNTITTCIESKGSYSISHRLISNKTKTVKWLKSKGRYVVKDEDRYIIGVAQDITIQRTVEDNLKQQKDIAEESSKIKSTFVASVSHEIRTPINGIIGMVSLLNTTTMNEKQKEYMNILHNSCGVLLSIINNILDFSKIESGKLVLDIEKFNIADAIDKTIDIFRLDINNKGLKLIYRKNYLREVIYSDEVKIRQILSNIMSNSIKFTRKGSIIVDVYTNDVYLMITVTDTGIGISDEFLKKISTPFMQESTGTTRNYGGSGLGMSIVSSYIKLMDGELNITSKVGQGTTTKIKIPFKVDINKHNKRYIVVVEDNVANQYIMKEMISALTPYPIICYDNGEQAVNSINDEPLIIFMDIHMPTMDGHEATRILRKRGLSCPIIALTANNIPGENRRCIEEGMNEFVLKPVSLSRIEKVLNDYVN